MSLSSFSNDSREKPFRKPKIQAHSRPDIHTLIQTNKKTHFPVTFTENSIPCGFSHGLATTPQSYISRKGPWAAPHTPTLVSRRRLLWFIVQLFPAGLPKCVQLLLDGSRPAVRHRSSLYSFCQLFLFGADFEGCYDVVFECFCRWSFRCFSLISR